MNRCSWVPADNPLYERYHDEEWGEPIHDDRRLFEMLILEGAQAGLSFLTILKRREGYRRAFKCFDPVAVAAMSDEDLENLMNDIAIIRNRLKIWSARKNARVFLAIQKEFGSFDAYVWRFVLGKVRVSQRSSHITRSAESDALAKDLKNRGMSFVGTTIMYAYMQAVGMVDDHDSNCFKARRHQAATKR